MVRFFDDDAQRLWLNSKPTLKMFPNKQEKEEEEKTALYLFHVESYQWNKNENANHQLQFSYLNEENNVRNGKVDGCAIETRERVESVGLCGFKKLSTNKNWNFLH